MTETVATRDSGRNKLIAEGNSFFPRSNPIGITTIKIAFSCTCHPKRKKDVEESAQSCKSWMVGVEVDLASTPANGPSIETTTRTLVVRGVMFGK